MDAFNDNNIKENKEIVAASNAPTSNISIIDIINANSHLANNITTGVVINNSKDVINSVNNEISNKKFESNESSNNSNMTIKSTLAATPSTAKPKTNKVDVTSIVREQPKVPTKPLPSSYNSTDETDRAAPGIDVMNTNNNNNKLTSKITSDQSANSTPKINSDNVLDKLPYQEGKIIVLTIIFTSLDCR